MLNVTKINNIWKINLKKKDGRLTLNFKSYANHSVDLGIMALHINYLTFIHCTNSYFLIG